MTTKARDTNDKRKENRKDGTLSEDDDVLQKSRHENGAIFPEQRGIKYILQGDKHGD
jgi:hypothetical protein